MPQQLCRVATVLALHGRCEAGVSGVVASEYTHSRRDSTTNTTVVTVTMNVSNYLGGSTDLLWKDTCANGDDPVLDCSGNLSLGLQHGTLPQTQTPAVYAVGDALHGGSQVFQAWGARPDGHFRLEVADTHMHTKQGQLFTIHYAYEGAQAPVIVVNTPGTPGVPPPAVRYFQAFSCFIAFNPNSAGGGGAAAYEQQILISACTAPADPTHGEASVVFTGEPLTKTQNGHCVIINPAVAMFSCDPGYEFDTDDVPGNRTCDPYGVWRGAPSGDEGGGDASTPHCKSRCDLLDPPLHGHADTSNNKATYSCDAGYQLSSAQVHRACVSLNGTDGSQYAWSGEQPACNPIRHPGLSPTDIGITAGAAAVLLLLLCVLGSLCCRAKRCRSGSPGAKVDTSGLSDPFLDSGNYSWEAGRSADTAAMSVGDFGRNSFASQLFSQYKEKIVEYRQIKYSDMKLGRKIGMGGSGAVFAAAWRGQDCAVKRLNYIMTAKDAAQFKAEVSLLSKLRHPSIVMFLGVSFKDQDCFLVTERCSRGSLLALLRNNTIALSHNMTITMARDTANGMNFLHLSGIVHRDLKSANLLVTEDFRIKICDFGISRDNADNNATMTSNLGTVPWTAPEMFRGTRYTEKVDVYSYGICVWEMVTRKFPFDGRNQVQVIAAVTDGVRPAIPSECPEVLENLMLECWHQNPPRRPSFGEVLSRLAVPEDPSGMHSYNGMPRPVETCSFTVDS